MAHAGSASIVKVHDNRYVRAYVLAGYMHPLHWLAAIIVALIVYSSILLWYRWRYPKRKSVNQQSVRPPWYRRWRVGRRDE